jgi:hypothetical protein
LELADENDMTGTPQFRNLSSHIPTFGRAMLSARSSSFVMGTTLTINELNLR